MSLPARQAQPLSSEQHQRVCLSLDVCCRRPTLCWPRCSQEGPFWLLREEEDVSDDRAVPETAKTKMMWDAKSSRSFNSADSHRITRMHISHALIGSYWPACSLRISVATWTFYSKLVFTGRQIYSTFPNLLRICNSFFCKLFLSSPYYTTTVSFLFDESTGCAGPHLTTLESCACVKTN